MKQDMNDTFRIVLRAMVVAAMTLLTVSAATAQDTPTGPRVRGNVYGGGNLATVGGSVTVNMSAGTVEKDVYGGGALANTNINNVSNYGTNSETISSTTNTTTVNLTGGTIKGDAYGGGLGRLYKEASAAVYYTQDEANTYNTEHGLQEGDEGYVTTATIKTPGVAEVTAVEAKVYGDVNVNLGSDGGSTATAFFITNYTGDHASVIKSGRVFGCNNLNGSPQGDVRVTVWKTVAGSHTRTASGNRKDGTDGTAHNYEVAAVYGGGNLANYTTATTGKKATVIIETCDVSIKEVYGGGNAAEVPGTDVQVNGAYEIAAVFGGGNGNDPYTTDDGANWTDNPGANIGNSTQAGNANTLLSGGLIHAAYGGSNKRGTIYGSISIDVGKGDNEEGHCDLDLEKMVGAGKDADVNGDLIMVLGCKPEAKIPVVYGGADNAHVNGDVMLTITSGRFGKVFGGNNQGGLILGRIRLNIEETADCNPAVPIEIDELYLGGNEAMYSMYGYWQDGTDANDAPVYKPRTAEMAADPSASGYKPAVTSIAGMTVRKQVPYEQPELNIISCTRIGRVYGGGLGEGAALYGDPIVNINMIPGIFASRINRNSTTGNIHALGEIGGKYTNENGDEVEGGVFGGGDGAAIYGNTTVNIGTATTVTMTSIRDEDDELLTRNVEGAYIVGDVYGGGREANVTGNTYVNVCAVQDDTYTTTDVIGYKGVTISGTGFEGVTIKGNVYGGGKGVTEAAGVTGAFECAKAMVGVVNTNNGSVDITKESTDKGTRVSIGNGTVEGTVYGGGEVGRVEWNGVVTIGLPVGTGETSAPIIQGNVFGGGKGVEQYGYAALMRGNTFVTVQADAKVRRSVYGGGEIASIGKYWINKKTLDPGAPTPPPGLPYGMPYSLANQGSGYCNVTIRGNAEIGPVAAMLMDHGDGSAPDDEGHVFGAGRGILPYEAEDNFKCQLSDVLHTGKKHPGRMTLGDVWECFETAEDPEAAYLQFVETQALATQTEVTIDGNAFVKGSVYGGSMNGHVQHNTHVTIEGDCQIGAGFKNGQALAKYTNWPTNTQDITESWAECAQWEFSTTDAVPYDPYAKFEYEGKYYYDADHNDYANGGSYIGKDGHTYYGNVFGGGSGVVPYKPGKWHREAGSVGGNTVVDITGGHILTSVYGGNECTDVGTYDNTSNRALLAGTGKCTINMVGGTVGVPRTVADIAAHPVTCYVFGGGKGDPRGNFNTWTNVGEAEVNISGNARIYGSTFGGGEDGHVLGNVTTNIGGDVTIGTTTHHYPTSINASTPGVIIGTQGLSGADGNIFGGGRGFSELALTAGVVCGNVTVNIKNGKMLGSVFGGGRLASVGSHLAEKNTANYGVLIPDGKDQVVGGNDYAASGATHGYINVNISGGTIGATDSDGKLLTSTSSIGDVFGGCKGSGDNKQFGQAKHTVINMTAGTVNGNVYGGGELGYVGEATLNTTTNVYEWKEESAGGGLCTVGISGGTVGGNVFGAGKGKADDFECEKALVRTTSVTISGTGTSVGGNVYGGGEVGRVDQNTEVTIGDGAGTEGNDPAPTIAGSVFGAGAGVETHGYSALVRGNATVTVQANASVGHSVYGGGMIASVGQYGLDSNFMPETLKSGGDCRVTVKGYAVIGTSGVGHVFGAGMGVNPFDENHNFDLTDATTKTGKPKRMTKRPAPDKMPALWDPVGDGSKYIWEYYTSLENYFKFLQTLALATDSYATVEGNAQVKGNVYGGSESGFVQRKTDVTIQGSSKILTTGTDTDGKPINGNVFGGGKGVSGFDMAGRVRGNANLSISGSSTVNGNVYGGGELGYVGKFSVSPNGRNYNWQNITNQDGNEETTGTCTVIINSATAEVKGNVFGAGKGEAITFKCEPAMTRTTVVNVNAGKVGGNVYGGGEIGRVDEDTRVTIGAATGDSEPQITNSVFGAGAGLETHGYSALVRGNTYVTVQNHAMVGHSVYGGGEIASVGKYGLDEQKMPSVLLGGGYCYVTVKGDAAITDDVFGAGRGVTSDFDKTDDDRTKRSRRMTVYNADDFPDEAKINAISGTATGQTSNRTTWEYYETGSPFVWEYFQEESDYLKYLETLALATHPEVNIEGNATVGNDVYGGGERGITKGSVIVNINGGTITKDVYGGGALANTNTTSTVGEEDYNTGEITKTTVDPTTTVILHSGTIGHNVYGGGLGRLENGSVTPIEAKVYGDILVVLNGKPVKETVNGKEVITFDAADENCNCVVKGNVFGCNNLNGSPQSGVTVHVYKTQGWTGHDMTAKKSSAAGGAIVERTGEMYELKAVYGGGDMAAYYPDDETARASAEARVIIDGCYLTSIETVYGGGNAASAPATLVTVNGAYEIGQVFGGGNGKDKITINGSQQDNPGANVGFLAYPEGTDYDTRNASPYVYGSGIAHAIIYGGTVHAVYGGSNTKGNIREKSIAELDGEANPSCTFKVEEAYGGGSNADQDGDAELRMNCIENMGTVYGGAENADVGPIMLNITNGTYDRVFGGNNKGGRINGSITVNIEETGCRPIIIGELYGGGNEAAYSIYGYTASGTDANGKTIWRANESKVAGGPEYLSPKVNVRSFTSIGDIYGGSYGATAKMVANPTVNINVGYGNYYNDDRTEIGENVKVSNTYPVPSHAKGTIGAINRVFGGGNAAPVVGNTNIHIGTAEYVEVASVIVDKTDVSSYYTRSGEGTQASPYVYTPTTAPVAEANRTYYMKVLGADIRDNVYGGGNAAEVTGDTNVVIGKKQE